MSKKFISARSRHLVRVCIQNSIVDENHSDVDIIEDTPQCSPKEHQENALPLAGSNKITGEKNVDPLFSGTRCFEDLITNFEENVGDKRIEPPPYLPLTPRPLSNFNAQVYQKQCMNTPINVEHIKSPVTYIQPNIAIAKENIEHPECLEEDVGEKSIEPPPCSPLTPRPLSNFNAQVYQKQCMNTPINVEHIKSPVTYIQPNIAIVKENIGHPECLEEDVGEKSIEPPPYSPLTPRPLSNFNVQVYEKQCMNSPINVKHIKSPVTHIQPHVPNSKDNIEHLECLEENVGEKSIEPPPYSPLTPRLPCNFNARTFEKPCMSFSPINVEHIKTSETHIQLHEILSESSVEPPKQNTLINLPSSPLRSMSPETTNLYNILTEDFENHRRIPETTLNINQNSPTASLASSDITEILFNSDDSVLDPDFACNNDIAESDTSSAVSELLISTGAEGYETLSEANGLQSSSHSNETLQTNTSESNRSSQGRPKKGRKRKYGGYTREERKKRKYQNLSYINSRKQHISPKQFLDDNCNCPKKCQDNISREDRLIQFQTFYSLGSYEAQNMFIAACVKEMPVKRSYVSNSSHSKKKTFTREYYLKDVLVCKKMFLNTLQTSSKRVNTSLSKKRNSCIKDQRGGQAGHNKSSSESEAFIINVIQKLPTYVSHYRRADCNDAKFLRSDMTLSKIYELYSDEAKLAGQKVLSKAKVKQVFLTKFNLRTKPLKKDTCNKCDYYSLKKYQGTEEEKALVEDAHKEHLQKANLLQKQLKTDMKLAQEDPLTEAITFDLQKTLPLPRIPTNVVFYKRQLWVYNLGIHSGSNDQAYCNVWVEGEAGRGSQEVGSCLIKHLTERLGDDVKNLILWSDSCGGQNRNIKLTLMLKAFLNDHQTLQTIRLRFLESGHSFLPNDTDFGRIECALKLQQRIYSPEDYMKIMQTCKKVKPMQVNRMRKEDFFSTFNLEKTIINRKKACDGSKVSWLNTKEIMMKKDYEFSIFMRSNLDNDYAEINLKKNTRGNTGRLTKEIMNPLWPNGKPIPEAKLNDLKSLINLIPEDAQNYYKKLTGDITVEDDIDGFSGEVDFEVEEDDINNE